VRVERRGAKSSRCTGDYGSHPFRLYDETFRLWVKLPIEFSVIPPRFRCVSYLIIQDCISYRVIGEGGRWLQDRAEALRFTTSDEALEYCRKHKIESYSLMVKFDDSEDARSQSTPTIFTLMTFSVSDSACALNAFSNAFACAGI